MSRKNQTKINVGDRFEEPLPGARSIMAALNSTPPGKKNPPTTVWSVIDLVDWNDIPHVRLKNDESGEMRLLANSVLQEGRLFKSIS